MNVKSDSCGYLLCVAFWHGTYSCSNQISCMSGSVCGLHSNPLFFLLHPAPPCHPCLHSLYLSDQLTLHYLTKSYMCMYVCILLGAG